LFLGTNKKARSDSTGGLSKNFLLSFGLTVSPPRHGMSMVVMAAVMKTGEHELRV
jgi:hypothetical protein